MSLEFQPWNALFFFVFIILPLIAFLGYGAERPKDERYKNIKNSNSNNDIIDLGKMGANEQPFRHGVE